MCHWPRDPPVVAGCCSTQFAAPEPPAAGAELVPELPPLEPEEDDGVPPDDSALLEPAELSFAELPSELDSELLGVFAGELELPDA